MINASGARIYRLALAGHTFLHVGSDGGLFEHPVEVDELLLANGERAELLVRGTGAPSTRSVLQTLSYDGYMPRTRPDDRDRPRDVLTLEYSGESPLDPVTIPDALRRVPLLDPAEAAATRVMLMSQGRISSKVMDLDRVEVSAPLGATDIWEVENLVGMDHPFHLHGFQFQVLDGHGVPEPQRRWNSETRLKPQRSSSARLRRPELREAEPSMGQAVTTRGVEPFRRGARPAGLGEGFLR